MSGTGGTKDDDGDVAVNLNIADISNVYSNFKLDHDHYYKDSVLTSTFRIRESTSDMCMMTAIDL